MASFIEVENDSLMSEAIETTWYEAHSCWRIILSNHRQYVSTYLSDTSWLLSSRSVLFDYMGGVASGGRRLGACVCDGLTTAPSNPNTRV